MFIFLTAFNQETRYNFIEVKYWDCFIDWYLARLTAIKWQKYVKQEPARHGKINKNIEKYLRNE